MAYALRALLCGPSIAAAVAAELRTGRAQLDAELQLVPLVHADPRDARMTSHEGDPFLFLSAAVEDLAVLMSRTAPIAFVEAEFFAGEGYQASIVWQDGDVALGPLVWNSHPDGGCPLHDRPVNAALAALGVRAGERPDPFELVGLGRHRWTQDWTTGDSEPAAGNGS